MDFYEAPISVYIKIDYSNAIVEVGSDIFITDISNWIKIDEGYGDRYYHAQSEYFDKPLVNENGTYNYIYKNGRIIEV